MADVQIRFRAQGSEAKREINQLTKEIQELRRGMEQADRTATQAAQVVDRLGDEAKEAAIGVTTLGRNIFKTSAEAKKFGGVFTDTQGRIRESNGEFAKTRETIDRLGDEARQTAADVNKLGDELEQAGRGTSGFSRGVGGAGREAGVARRAIGLLGTVVRDTLTTFGAFAALDISYAIGRSGVESVRAAGAMEQYLRATQQITGSAAAAEARIEDLVEIANLPGLNFEPLTRFSNRLLAAGVGAEDANKILLTVGQTIVSLGGSADRAALAMEQIIQAIQLGQVDFRDFRTIVQQIPGFYSALADVHGVEANIEGLREAFNRVGGDMIGLLIPTFDELARRFESPPPDSYIVTIDRLQNAFFLLQAEIGERFLPIVTRGAAGLAELFENITAFLDAPGSAAEATAAFTSSVNSLNASLANVDSLEKRNEAVKIHISLVEDQIETLERFAASEARHRGRQTFALRGVDPTTLRRDEDVAAILELQGELENLQGVLEGSALAIDYFQSQADDLSASVRLQQQEVSKLAREQRELAISGDTSSQTYKNLNKDIIQANDVLEVLRSEMRRYSAIVRIAEDNANTYALSSQLLAASQEAAAQAIRNAEDALRDGAISYGEYVAASARVRENIEALAGGQAALNDFWRVASGQVEDYTESIQATIPSLVNLTAAENALTAAIEANLQTLQAATGDPLSDYIDGLTLTSEAADAAFGSINRVGEAVRDADFRRAEAELRDFDDAFRLSEATIPRVRSEMERFTGTLPDATRSIRDTTIALRNLSQEAQAAARDAEFLNASFSALDAFDPRTPDLNAQSFDTVGFAARTGEELASQAIRTAGQLRRIEQERVENLADLEREYSEQIIAINEEKRTKLAAVEQQIEEERVRRLASIEQAFADAADAEVKAREKAAERIQQIEARAAEARERLRERLNNRLLELEQRRDARIQELNDGFIEREQDRQQEILSITERAAEARAEAEQRYADTVQEINNRLVEDVLAVQRQLAEDIESLEAGFVQRQADRAGEIVRITEEAAAARTAANQVFVDTMQEIYNDLVEAWDDLEEGFLERQEDRAAERIAIEQRSADARVAANEEYAETIADISTDLVDEIRRIESEIVDVQQEHAEERFAIEQESIQNRTEANAEYARRLEEIETERGDRLAQIQQEAAAARLRADETYADRFQDIQNDLVDSVVDIQKDLNDTLNDLRDEQLDAEQDRLDNLVELHEDTQQTLQDLERNRARTLEDLREEFRRDELDAATRLDRELADADTEEDREEAIKRYNRRIQDLTKAFHRDVLDLQKEQARAREDLARQTAAREVQIAEQAQAEKERIAQEEAAARAQAQEGIASVEEAAGVSFSEAQENYVPALSAHEQALLTHAEALNRINQEAEQATSEVLQTSFDDAATAALTLSEALSAVTAAEQEKLSALETETTGTLSGLNQQITDAQTRTGLSFEEALINYTPAVDLNTQALQALTAALGEIDAEEVSALSAVDVAEAADRRTTQTAQQVLETEAGVSIEAARANFVPALSSAAQATLTLNATMRELDTSFREAIAEIQESGLVDRQAVDAAVQTRITEATAQQTALETQAGTTFAEASLAFQPGLSDIAQASVDRDTALGDIDRSEIEGIEGINAQSIADRLETDAAITEARDAYIKARDTEIFAHNVAMLQLNTEEAADIRSVRATLSKNLVSIDGKLDVELAEIRETKIVFDTRMSELIDAINEQANFDVANLKEDTAAMREELEAIAEEERNNAWKGAILKVANVGITIAGVAAGTALGNPVAGLAVGQAVGGVVEQGGNELFHYPQTDRIARNIARQSVLRQSRPTPNYLPDANQIRNARDVSREIVAGVTEGLNIGSRRDGGLGDASQQASFPEEITAQVVIQFPDGSTQELADQILRLRDQDRTNL